MIRARYVLIGLTLIAVPAASPPARAADERPAAPETQAVKVGPSKETFSQRSPLSDPQTIMKRVGWSAAQLKRDKVNTEYDLADESFEVYVPEDYTGRVPFGLIVWVTPGPSGQGLARWLPVLDKHHLIWVGANKSGNDRSPLIRVGLALDAAHNMAAQYAIDEKRVYVAGASGGGRISSLLGMTFPDVFRGGFYLIGCDFYRNVPGDEPNSYFPALFLPPAPDLLALTKKRSRHVLLTGETDPNRPQTKANHRAMRKEGFEHVRYFEVPGMGHETPDAEWFEKGIVALEAEGAAEAPAEARAAAALKAARAAAAKDPAHGYAALAVVWSKYPGTEAAKAASAEAQRMLPGPASRKSSASEDDAARVLRVARLYMTNKRYDDARARLKDLIEHYPDSPAAAEAAKLLQDLKGK